MEVQAGCHDHLFDLQERIKTDAEKIYHEEPGVMPNV